MTVYPRIFPHEAPNERNKRSRGCRCEDPVLVHGGPARQMGDRGDTGHDHPPGPGDRSVDGTRRRVPLELDGPGRALAASGVARPYLAMDGFPDYVRAVQGLLFGKDHPAVAQGRVTTVQAVGGTGGLKVGADFIRRFAPEAAVYMSDPTYDNHRPLFEEAGYRIESYPYYDTRTRGIRFPEMIAAMRAIPKGSVLLLHACCHNPTGVDIRGEQWDEVIKIVAERRLIPFLDFAYQGFGDGIEEDAQVARRFAEELPVVLVAMSFSKSFSLYGERVGSLSVVATDSGEAARVLSNLKRMIRTNYSNPPRS